jgi:competence ComEA-like helix-hairpin-helix protein
MKKVPVFLTSLLIWSLTCQAAFEESLFDARSLALGGAGVMLYDHVPAGLENPAAPCYAKNQNAASGGFLPFGMSELAVGGASLSYKKEKLGLGLSLSSMGSGLYRENTVRTSISFRPLTQTGFGLGFSGYNLNIERYGSANAVGLDLGLIGSPLENLTLAAMARNINRPKIGNTGQEAAQWLSFGVSYELMNKLICLVQLQDQKGFRTQLRFGQEYRYRNILALRAGFSQEPNSFSFGFGIFLKKCRVDYGTRTHPQLGMSQALTVSYVLQTSVPEEEKIEIPLAPVKNRVIDKIDPNTAGPDELQLLPGVGQGTAAAIIAYRDSAGLFQYLDDLDKVKGVSRGLLEKLAPFVTLRFRPADAAEKINLNLATKEQLISLPGIGEKTANDIIEYRGQHGKFGSIEDIMNVKGIGRKTFEGFKELITVE